MHNNNFKRRGRFPLVTRGRGSRRSDSCQGSAAGGPFLGKSPELQPREELVKQALPSLWPPFPPACKCPPPHSRSVGHPEGSRERHLAACARAPSNSTKAHEGRSCSAQRASRGRVQEHYRRQPRARPWSCGSLQLGEMSFPPSLHTCARILYNKVGYGLPTCKKREGI